MADYGEWPPDQATPPWLVDEELENTPSNTVFAPNGEPPPPAGAPSQGPQENIFPGPPPGAQPIDPYVNAPAASQPTIPNTASNAPGATPEQAWAQTQAAPALKSVPAPTAPPGATPVNQGPPGMPSVPVQTQYQAPPLPPVPVYQSPGPGYPPLPVHPAYQKAPYEDQGIDAISGSPNTTGIKPMDTYRAVAADPNASVADRQEAWLKLSPEERTNIVNSGDPKQLAAIATAAMSPEELATIQVRHQQAQMNDLSAQQLDASRRNAEQATRNYFTQKSAMDQTDMDMTLLQHDIQNLSSKKIDTKLHGLDVVGAALLGGVGGAFSQYTGGRNLALESIDKNIERNIDAQKEEINNGWKGIDLTKNVIASQYALHGDQFRAAEAYRQTMYAQTIGDLQTAQQMYDPKGTTALQLAQTIQGVQSASTQAMNAYQQKVFDNRLAAAKAQAELDEKEANAAKARMETLKISGGIGGGAGDTLTPTQLKAKYPGLPDYLYPTVPTSEKLFGKTMELGKTSAETVKAYRENATQLEGFPVGVDPKTGQPIFGPLRMRDNSVFIPKDPKSAEVIDKMKPHVMEVNRLANQLSRDIADMGVMDKAGRLGTNAHQVLTADKEALIFALHGANNIEGFRPGTADLLEKELGGVDPDSWGRDATAGILKARDNINSMFNEQLHSGGWDGAFYSPADTSTQTLKPPVDTPIQKATKDLIVAKEPAYGPDSVHTDKLGDLKIIPSDYVQLSQLASQMALGNKEAGEALFKVATESRNHQIRDFAKDLLQHASAANIPVPGERVGPSTSTARDEVQKPPKKDDD